MRTLLNLIIVFIVYFMIGIAESFISIFYLFTFNSPPHLLKFLIKGKYYNIIVILSFIWLPFYCTWEAMIIQYRRGGYVRLSELIHLI